MEEKDIIYLPFVKNSTSIEQIYDYCTKQQKMVYDAFTSKLNSRRIEDYISKNKSIKNIRIYKDYRKTYKPCGLGAGQGKVPGIGAFI